MLIRRGVINELTYVGDTIAEGISVMLSENDPDGSILWQIRVYVHIPQGTFLLGFLTTNFAAIDGAPARVVCMAGCPGAIGWKVEVIAASGFPEGNEGFDAECYLQAGKCCGGGMPFGVFHPPQPPGGGGGGGT